MIRFLILKVKEDSLKSSWFYLRFCGYGLKAKEPTFGKLTPLKYLKSNFSLSS